MRTQELIRTLEADQAAAPVRLGQRLLVSLAVAWLVSAILFGFTLGPRGDIANAAAQPRFVFKFVITLLLAATAIPLALRLVQPGATTRRSALALAVVPALLALAVIIELFVVPAPRWGANLIGSNAAVCLVFVPLFSLAPLAGALMALRLGAPTEPSYAGAVAGLLAGGLGAALYAAHCPDDSPLFVAAWYSLAIGFMAMIGALAGRKVLRW